MKYWIKAHSFHRFETVVVVVPQGRTSSVIFKVFAQVSYFSLSQAQYCNMLVALGECYEKLNQLVEAKKVPEIGFWRIYVET